MDNQQDSEPLFGDDVYNLLRDDSLLQRTGSINFASLIEPSNAEAGSSQQQELQQQQVIQQNLYGNGERTRKPEHQAVKIIQGIIQQEQPQVNNGEQTRKPEHQAVKIIQGIIQQEQPQVSQQIQERREIKQEEIVHVVNVVEGTSQLQQQEGIKIEHNYPVQTNEGLQQQEKCIVYGIPVSNYTNGNLQYVTSEPSPSVSSEQQQQPDDHPLTIAWDGMDEDEDTMIEEPNTGVNFISNPSNSFMNLLDEASSFLPDTTSRGVPSLQPWPGKYSFSISLPVDNKDRNKWCYNEELRKLYVCPNVAVPLNITLSKWVDACITITPVFQQSQYRMDPVYRCYNCKNINNCDEQLIDHIVQVDGEGCLHEVEQERPVVKVPVQSPSPGEQSSILLLKLMCLTSCVGGPNRRPFCLVLTLRCNVTGSEIGRQILDVKCCKCPSRDMNNDLKAAAPASNKTKLDEGQVTKIRKLSSQIHVGQKRKKPKVKPEPGIETRYVNIAVPVEFELQVKSYVNGLIAEQILRRNQPNLLLYPEDET